MSSSPRVRVGSDEGAMLMVSRLALSRQTGALAGSLDMTHSSHSEGERNRAISLSRLIMNRRISSVVD